MTTLEMLQSAYNKGGYVMITSAEDGWHVMLSDHDAGSIAVSLDDDLAEAVKDAYQKFYPRG